MPARTAGLVGLREQFDRAEQLRLEAAEAERAAFERWQDAYAAHDMARDDTSAAWAAWSRSLAHS